MDVFAVVPVYDTGRATKPKLVEIGMDPNTGGYAATLTDFDPENSDPIGRGATRYDAVVDLHQQIGDTLEADDLKLLEARCAILLEEITDPMQRLGYERCLGDVLSILEG